MAAIRFTAAKNQMPSPASSRAINVFRPSSLSDNHTSRAVRAFSARSAANSGSASNTAAVKIWPNRDHDTDSTNPAIAASTSAAASALSSRVAWATFCAFQARTSPATVCRHNNGSR